ncbi:MAG TPA: hypothetical protein VFQ43_05020 [Nitrososphaera sp.]|nr:hypothetical protein [Nitrososphaera sp.]
MFWARKRFRPINDPRPSVLIAGVYSTVVAWTGMYYAARWGIVSWESIREDFIGFPITVLSVTTVVIIFFSIGVLADRKRSNSTAWFTRFTTGDFLPTNLEMRTAPRCRRTQQGVLRNGLCAIGFAGSFSSFRFGPLHIVWWATTASTTLFGWTPGTWAHAFRFGLIMAVVYTFWPFGRRTGQPGAG